MGLRPYLASLYQPRLPVLRDARPGELKPWVAADRPCVRWINRSEGELIAQQFGGRGPAPEVCPRHILPGRALRSMCWCADSTRRPA